MSVALATRVREQVLEPAMDARALNLDQAKALHNPETEEVDSYLEYLSSVEHRLPRDVHGELVRYGWLVVELNGREGEVERAIAGDAEGLSAALYSAAARRPTAIQHVADELREALAVVLESRSRRKPNPPEREIALANRIIRAAVRDLPVELLTNERIADELGQRKTAVLLEYVAAATTRGRAS